MEIISACSGSPVAVTIPTIVVDLVTATGVQPQYQPKSDVRTAQQPAHQSRENILKGSDNQSIYQVEQAEQLEQWMGAYNGQIQSNGT